MLKEDLLTLRTKVISNFNDPQLMFSAFKTESDTNKGYNGRQVLELFQNCDDENSPEVLIEIDKDNNVFRISNIGNPFSEKGYNSLFYASLSSKVSGKFIGNKGLGFRSIINWAEEINIYSNGLCLKYANRFIEKAFKELYPQENQRKELLNERGYVDNVIPLPLLSYPDITEKNLENGYTTTIEIFYKKGFYSDIVEQVSNIKEETLLFLNTIQTVKFKGFLNQENIVVTRKDKLEVLLDVISPTSSITINNKTWNIVEEQNQLDDKYQDKKSLNKDFYQLKIAFQNDFSDDINRLYSYFLTEEPLSFPFLIHGTFELDQNRKRISNDKNENGVSKNEFILKRLATLIINTAKYFSKEATRANWKPLLFLKHNKTNTSLTVFFQILESQIFSEKLFPCVNNSYYKKSDVVYISDSFSRMIQNLSLENFFPNHLIPTEDDISLLDYRINSSIESIVSIVNKISKTELSIENRALFIYELVKAFPNKQFDFLIDEYETPIKADEYIFTPKTKSKDLIKPIDTKIQFLNRDLYTKLSRLFGFDNEKSLGRSRFVMQKLSDNCNINEYEPNRLALKIISETNKKIKASLSNNISIIQEMNRCLYHNFLQTEEVSDFNKDVSVRTINKNGEIAVCKNLYLSNYYPTGKLTEEIFKEIYKKSEFIGSPKLLGLDTLAENFNIEKVEEFLIWLQTNKFAKYNTYSSVTSGLGDYVRFVQNYNSSIVDYRGYTISYKEIADFQNILNELSLESFLLWINVDDEIQSQLNDNDNGLNYKLQFVYNRVETISKKPSLIKYKILSNNKFQFQNHLIDDKTEWMNNIKINYENSVFTNNDISKTKINNCLLLLNAKEDFNNLSISYITDLFNKLNIYAKDLQGKGSQSFYKKVYNHYKLRGLELTKPVKLFAKTNDEFVLLDQNKIYFSDNIKLPENLTFKYPIFNYPSRSGGDLAIKLFKINDIKNLNTELKSSDKNESLSNAFNDVFTDFKPFVLAYRLENLTTQKIKERDSSKLKNIIIELCNTVECSIDEDKFIIDDYDYYYKGNNHYLIAVNSNNLAEVLLEPKFADSFAEILASTFSTNNEKDDFRYIIRNSKKYNQYLIEQKFGLGIIEEAKVLLGQANEKNLFWKNIYQLKNWDTSKLNKNDYSAVLIELKLNSLPNIGYSNLNTFENYQILEILFNDLNIDISSFNINSIENLNLSKLHYKNIENEILKKSSLIKSSIWKSLENSSISKQAEFLKLLSKLKNKEKFILTKAKKYKSQFDVDLKKIVSDFIKDKYPDLVLFELLDLEKKKDLNLKNFNANEEILIESNLRWFSLIFFKSAVEIIKIELNLKLEEQKEKDFEKNTIIPQNNIKPILLDSAILKLKTLPKTKSLKKTGVYLPTFNSERKKIKKGKSSEKTILDYFKNNNFKDVDPVSKFDPYFHYDIQYTNDRGIVKYVEVKTFDSGNFYLSKLEYDFGFQNKENYEIWLVKDENIIIPIYDFFSNPKYKTTVSEYIIHLEID